MPPSRTGVRFRNSCDSSLTVYELIDQRLADREEQLKREIQREFECKYEKAIQSLESESASFADNLSRYSSASRQAATFTADVESKLQELEESVRVYARVLRDRTETGVPFKYPDLNFVETVRIDLLLFRRAVHKQWLVSVDESGDQKTNEAAREISESLYRSFAFISRKLGDLLEQSSSSTIPSLDLTIEAELDEIHRLSPDSLNEDYANEIRGELTRLRLMLQKLEAWSPENAPAESDLKRLDEKYLRMIAELSTLVFDLGSNGVPSTEGNAVIARTLPCVLSANPDLLFSFLEGADDFIQHRFPTDKRLARFVQFELSRWSRLSNR